MKKVLKILKSYYLVIYLFLSLTLLFTSLLKRNVDYSAFENRILTHLKFPTLQGIYTGEWFTATETAFLDQVPARNMFIETNSRCQRMLGKRQFNNMTVGYDNTLFRLNSDFALQISLDYSSPKDDFPDFRKEVLLPCKSAVDSYGGQLYYMNIYPRNLYFWNQFPYHLDETMNGYLDQNTDTMSLLKSDEICTVDTYPAFRSHDDEYLYFFTDHHYTYKGAYYSYLSLLDSINSNNPGKKPLAFPEWSHMDIYRPNRQFWGSMICQIGDTQYAGRDFLEYALPKDYPASPVRTESGELSDIPLILENPTEEYGWFMGEDMSNTVIRTDRPELPKILIIGHSFTNAIEVMSVYTFDEMHSIDPRYFEGDILSYIKNEKCDYVVIQGDFPISEFTKEKGIDP